MGLRKVSTKRCDQLHGFNAMETNLSFWMGLRKIPTNMCAQLHVFSQCRLSQVFDGTWKNFHKKVCPVTRFVRCGDYLKFLMGLGKIFTKKCAQLHVLFAVETILSFGWDLEKYRQKSVPSHTFLRCGDYLKFLRRVGKFRQKGVTSYTFLSQYRLSQVFDGTWKNFHKKVCTVTRFVRCGDYLKFLMGLGKIFTKKVCPVTRFVLCGDYLKFWMGLRKVSTKLCAQLHVLFAVETILGFGWDLEKFRQNCVPSYTFSQCRLSQVFDGTWKVSTKSCDQLHLFGSADYLKFLDGTWKNFHKKVCPVTRFVRCGDYLKFLMGLGKIFTKKCAQLHVLFAVETILSFGWDLEKYRQKSVPSHTFLRCGDYLKFLRRVGKFRQKGVTSYTFLSQYRLSQVFDGTWKNFHKKVCTVTRFVRCGDYLKFLMGLGKIFTKKVCPVTRFVLCGDYLKFCGT